MEIDPQDHHRGSPIKSCFLALIITVKEQDKDSEKQIGEELRADIEAGREDRHRPDQGKDADEGRWDDVFDNEVQDPDNNQSNNYFKQDKPGRAKRGKEAIENDLREPLVVNPGMVWSRIGIKVMERQLTTPNNLSAKKEMAPKVGIHLRIRKKISGGGKEKKPESEMGCRFQLCTQLRAFQPESILKIK